MITDPYPFLKTLWMHYFILQENIKVHLLRTITEHLQWSLRPAW